MLAIAKKACSQWLWYCWDIFCA